MKESQKTKLVYLGKIPIISSVHRYVLSIYKSRTFESAAGVRRYIIIIWRWT